MVVVCRAREARRARKALIARTTVVAADIADTVPTPVVAIGTAMFVVK